MGHYSHLSIEEREDSMALVENHESISQIARKARTKQNQVFLRD